MLSRPEPYADIAFTGDARRALIDRDITVDEVTQALQKGTVLRVYPETTPTARLLLTRTDREATFGTYDRRRPVHVVTSNEDEAQRTTVITAYEPDPSQWTDQFRWKRTWTSETNTWRQA
jgi:hypothetical protein